MQLPDALKNLPVAQSITKKEIDLKSYVRDLKFLPTNQTLEIILNVEEGQTVKSNMVIAKTNTVKNSDKEVVHYELFYKGKPVNPLYYLP